VAVAGRTATKPSVDVAPDEELAVRDVGPRWVGRAAYKLAAALQAWGPEGLSARGRRCIDIGASTGGFTEVLLACGAASVVAVDVGHGQLVARLARDPRVEERSGTTVRGLRPEDVGGVGDLVVADLSFISLTLVMPDLTGLLAPDGDLVVLVKPQFEVGRARLSRQGVVTSPGDRESALLAVVAAVHASGLRVRGTRRSPISGTTGNSEYLLWARSDPSDTMSGDRVREVVREITNDEAGGAR
jgi:23S rRNA (cytidine1920-2'-O)/16S rRNA (cytidine1409-2'-O)-methyltransferase